MNVVVLAPSADYATYAGARIRYGRIVQALANSGVSLVLEDLGGFDPERSDADVFIFSKCHDARALVAAAVLERRGRVVGIDLFDDYFSQAGDSRLSRYRNWLAQILRHCAFALCSTQAMSRVVESYRADLPVHVMNDPGPPYGLEELRDILERKRRSLRETGRMTIAWFGVGDNPNFPVGVHDLAGFSGALRELLRGGMNVRLRVLTNARALTADRLAQLRNLPVSVTLGEWSEDAEKDLLAEAFAAFLPVNLQPFSTAKSLNRALTALTAGCQVLSAGFPLYRQLESLVYVDPKTLLEDLANDSLRLSPENLSRFETAMNAFGSAAMEARGLADFLRKVDAPRATSDILVLVHGHSTNGVAHKMIQSSGGLSVASPFCTAKLGFDVIFEAAVSGLRMFVSEKASKRLQNRAADGACPGPVISGKKFVEVTEPDRIPGPIAAKPWALAPVPFQLAMYADSMHHIRRRVVAAFGPCSMLISETSQLPFAPIEQ